MSNELVVNELLAFLQQTLDVMNEVSAVQICVTNFSEDDIAVAKRLLFGVLNKTAQMVSHRRDGTKKSLQEVITLLRETDPDDVPTFVAKDLHKLPPVTFDHVDVTSLLKDIVFLKASLTDVQQKYDVSQANVENLRKEVIELSNVVTGSRSQSHVNTKCGACLDSSFASAVMTSPPASTAEPAHSSPARAPRKPATVPAAVNVPRKEENTKTRDCVPTVPAKGQMDAGLK